MAATHRQLFLMLHGIDRESCKPSFPHTPFPKSVEALCLSVGYSSTKSIADIRTLGGVWTSDHRQFDRLLVESLRERKGVQLDILR